MKLRHLYGSSVVFHASTMPCFSGFTRWFGGPGDSTFLQGSRKCRAANRAEGFRVYRLLSNWWKFFCHCSLTDGPLCELHRYKTRPSLLWLASVLRETGNLLLVMSLSQIVVKILRQFDIFISDIGLKSAKKSVLFALYK